ncbi:MAG TPA: hypothetical protein VFX04_08940, partial [Rhodanobacteraceae bacterium]|nr:hypothetical protein [Rhodanobacteraceae bacterium]
MHHPFDLPPLLRFRIDIRARADRKNVQAILEAVLRECLAQRGGFVDAYAKFPERRIIQALDMDPAVLAVRKDIGRPINRIGHEHPGETDGYADQEIAMAERLGGRAKSPLHHVLAQVGHPVEGHRRVHGVGQHLGDPVIDALALLVRERHVAGIDTRGKGTHLLVQCRLFRGGFLRGGQLIEVLAGVEIGLRLCGAHCGHAQGKACDEWNSFELHVARLRSNRDNNAVTPSTPENKMPGMRRRHNPRHFQK